MSLSKRLNANGCRNCLTCMSRQLTSESTNAAEKHFLNKMASFSSKTMTVSQWKLIAQIKDQLTKPIDKNGVMFVINKEFTNILKKLPAVASQFKQNFEIDAFTKSKESSNVPSTDNNNVTAVTDNTYGLSPLINDIRQRFQHKPVVVEDEKTQWKTKKTSVSSPSITSRTKYVISSVILAESDQSKLKRVEDLIEHLFQYPEAVNVAIQEGGIRMLLKLRKSVKDNNTLAAVKEALTILGYVEPLPNQGVRILSIDGGGVRGLLVLEMLRKLENLTGKRVHEMFDYICGVSTGSVLACTVGTSKKSLEEVAELYRMLSNKIFTQNAFQGTRSLLWSHAYYDTALWETMLKDYVGSTQMIKTSRIEGCPKIGAVSTVANQGRVLAFVFRNYEMPFRIRSQYLGSSKYKLWEAARASAAAPAYFEEFKLGGLLHQDGGVLVNNPTAVALHEAKQLWPNQPIQCVVSFGTGRISPIMKNGEQQIEIPKASSWAEKFYKILDSATDTEAVHTMLNDLLPGTVYYRFNPYLTEMLSMVEYQPEKLKQLEQDAAMYIRRNEEKFQEAAEALMQPKTYTQQCKEYIKLQSTCYGFM